VPREIELKLRVPVAAQDKVSRCGCVTSAGTICRRSSVMNRETKPHSIATNGKPRSRARIAILRPSCGTAPETDLRKRVRRPVYPIGYDDSDIELNIDEGANRGGPPVVEASEVELELKRGKSAMALGEACSSSYGTMA